MNPFNCSKILLPDKHAWTEGYEELFGDLKSEDQEMALLWVKWNLWPQKSFSKRTSYGLKHLLQRDTHIYMTNNQFKDLMLACGYRVKNQKELNWCFNAAVAKGADLRDHDGSYPQWLSH